MLQFMTMRNSVVLAGTVLVASVLALLAAGQIVHGRLAIEGPLDAAITRSRALLADYQAPTGYLLEPLIEATLALGDPVNLQKRAQRLEDLRTQYDVRRSHWLQAGDEQSLALIEKAHLPARRFWSVVGWSFIPALKRGDMPAAHTAYAEMVMAFEDHRARVAELAAFARGELARTQAEARSHALSATTAFWVVALLLLGMMIAAVVGLIARTIGPIGVLIGTMVGIARGNLATDVPFLSRTDEVGAMAQSLAVLKEAMIARKLADDEAAGDQRARALRELREMEDWISRERPSFEAVARRAHDLRRRYLSVDALPALAAPDAAA